MMKAVAGGILSTMIIGLITAFVGLYLDVDRLKAGEASTQDKLDTVLEEVRDIKWFLIERNGDNIKPRGK